MGVRGRWSWLLVVGLVFGSGFGAHALVRRQAHGWWGNDQPPRGWGPPRGAVQHVSGLGSLRWGPAPVAGWGTALGYNSGGSQSRQMSSLPSSPIRVQCGQDKMVVTVMRDFYGNGKLVKASDLSLGPLACKPTPQSMGTNVLFNISLQECGNKLEMTPDWLIYTTKLNYSPKSSPGASITRTNPAVIPIQCYYPRHGNVSSKAIHPTWSPFSATITSEERLSFSLRLMTDDWHAPRSSLVFQLGDVLFIEASVDTQNHAPMILFIDRCVATLTPNANSSLRYEIIASNGCLVDGLQEDSSSIFRSPRTQPDKLQFSVDAFQFVGTDTSMIYITCNLRATAVTQTPDPMNKACSYSKASGRWSALEGSNDICHCCDTGNCAATTGQSRRWGHDYGSRRGIVKREVGVHKEEHGLATLGPLLMITEGHNPGLGAASSRTSRIMTTPLELWMLVAIGSVSFVVVAVALVVAGKCVLKLMSCGKVIEK